MHDVQLVGPVGSLAAAYLPASQSEQADDPGSAAYVPSAQFVQVTSLVAAVAAEDLPATQLVQLTVVPVPMAYFPASQSAHETTPATTAYLPAWIHKMKVNYHRLRTVI